MTPTAALYQFWSSFGITAYPSNRVPEDTTFPFITYEPIIANWWTGAAAASTVNIWYHTESEAVPNKKGKRNQRQIARGHHGKMRWRIYFPVAGPAVDSFG